MEKVKICIEADKQYIRDVMLAIGITAADPAMSVKLMDEIGDEIVINAEAVAKDKEQTDMAKLTFAAAAIATAADNLESKEK